jgi:hypothetical protein
MSADFLDDASENESKERERLIAKARNGVKVQATGHCLYCNQELPNDQRWCDQWCREDWQIEQDARKRNWR